MTDVEADVLLLASGRYKGVLVGETARAAVDVVWYCDHEHRTDAEARDCAQTELSTPTCEG